MTDPYLDPSTGILRNRCGCTNQRDLSEAEDNLVNLRLIELWRSPLNGTFDRRHICAVHHHLFQDVFDWAGQLRTVDIARENAPFATAGFVAACLDQLANALAKEKYLKGLDINAFANRAAFHFGELNAIHPFREGNGRMQREFIRHLALANGFAFDWDRTNRKDMYHASERSFRGDYAPMRTLFESVIRPATASEIGVRKRKL